MSAIKSRFGLLSISTLLSVAACSMDRVDTRAQTPNEDTGGTSSLSTGGASSLSSATSTNASGGSSSGGVAGTGGRIAAGPYDATIVSCGMPAPAGAAVDKPAGTPGNLKVLNWAGYKGAATYTFDDGNSSQIANYAKLKALGVRYTFYLVTTWGGATDPLWPQAIADGHEIGNHTKSHTQGGGSADEVDGATQWLEDRFGIKVWTMAAPYGESSYTKLAETRFLINRGVNNTLIRPNDGNNPFSLPCYLPPKNGTAAVDMNPQIDQAESGGGWRVVLVHGFTGGSDGAYNPVSIDEFVANVEHAKSLGDVWIDSMVNVAAYWRGQKMFTSVTPTTSGSDTTWTWILPDHFPPGRCLRVTVDGGTLKQGDQQVAWDSHGYYEVALDKGTLTLSP
jgi:peptidoglycan/xylan/chitin deacetylase (PgdA/CDA1 family)